MGLFDELAGVVENAVKNHPGGLGGVMNDALAHLGGIDGVVKTLNDAGLGAQVNSWLGLAAPAGTPEPVVARLNAEINKALGLPEVAQQLAVEGAVPMPGTPQAFGDLIQRELPRWAEVVRAGKVKPD